MAARWRRSAGPRSRGSPTQLLRSWSCCSSLPLVGFGSAGRADAVMAARQRRRAGGADGGRAPLEVVVDDRRDGRGGGLRDDGTRVAGWLEHRAGARRRGGERDDGQGAGERAGDTTGTAGGHDGLLGRGREDLANVHRGGRGPVKPRLITRPEPE